MSKKALLSLMLFICSFGTQAEGSPPGYLWYNLPKEEKVKEHNLSKAKSIPFKSLSFTDRDKVLEYYTMEALHKARQTKSVKDMRTFLTLKNYWLNESSEFSHLFQKTMLYYPELDHTVSHPTSSVGTQLYSQEKANAQSFVINKLAKTHGILFFYRGASPFDKKVIPVLHDLKQKTGIHVLPISVDGQGLYEFDNAVVDSGQADKFNVRFFPAILLLNPNTKKLEPVAYGMTSSDVLKERLYDIATNYKGDINAATN